MDSGDEEVQLNDNSKKRKRVPKEWAKNTTKQRRNSGEGKAPTVACQHPIHSYCQARALDQVDREDMFRDCYVDSDKVRQDTFITSYVELTPVKRHRGGNNQRRARTYTAEYYARKHGGEIVQVCQQTFMSLLCIGRKRLGNLLKYVWENNNRRPERRGGFRAKTGYEELKADICRHIQSFKCRASHYGRGKTPHRKYLPSTLNVHRMYQLFKEQYNGPIDVKYGMYHGIFVSNFNLGFGAPRKDVCSFCTSQMVKVRAATDEQKKR
ncbi:uncharacterized protein [Amphiura filiformis]|uniref:uncharacterized protein isoform X2 n=1 Tax=Amphiura filiformis TaxID=82378 RepID=UPI003B223F3E